MQNKNSFYIYEYIYIYNIYIYIVSISTVHTACNRDSHHETPSSQIFYQACIVPHYPPPLFLILILKGMELGQGCGSGLIVSGSTKFDEFGSRSIKTSKLISKHRLKVKKKLLIFKSEPYTLEISSHQENVGDDVLRFRLEKI